MELDFRRIAEEATALQNAGLEGASMTSVYWKPSAGTHFIRPLPYGNEIDKLPYFEVVQHSYTTTGPDGRKVVHFCLCYNHIVKHLSTLTKYLVGVNKLAESDLQMFQRHGCPGCVTKGLLQQNGATDEVWKPNIPRTSFIFNLIDRKDGKVYVWNASKTVVSSIFAPLQAFMSQGMHPLDPNTGFDVCVIATGEGFQRRYKSVNWMTISKPAGLEAGQTWHDLYEIAAKACRKYEEFANIIASIYGKHYAALGKTVPGSTLDTVLSEPSTLPASVVNTISPPSTELKPIGDGLFMRGNQLVGSDGKTIF